MALHAPLGDVAERVARATERLRHRGPDGSGQFVGDRFCFGHRRLTIVDPASGLQPMQSVEMDGVITYNGEVYNCSSLRQELEREGRRFHTDHSDTEVVLQAMLKWGAAGLRRLRGMFAFAVADASSVLLARDRVGKKPLFYTIRGGVLWFSSELEPLWTEVGPFKIDLRALDQYLTWQYVPAPRTIYQGVHALPAGHFLAIDLNSGNHRVERYWSLAFKQDNGLTAEDWERALDRKLREAVEIRLMSDVPYGAFLSGGIDSSLVVGYMSELLDRPVRTFSIGFEEEDHSELKYADRVAQICATDHHTEIVKARSLHLLPTLVDHFGQPFSDSSAIPTFHVARMARNSVAMVLSGDGGDENFAGYNTYPAIIARIDDQEQSLATLILSKVFGSLWTGAGRAKAVVDAHAKSYRVFSNVQRRGVYRNPFKSLAEDALPERDNILSDASVPLLSRLQALDIATYLSNDILVKVDTVSMANSLEVRCPLLDHELVELAATMPPELKLDRQPGPGFDVPSKKHLLKKLALRRFPMDIVERPKQGFGLPLGAWFANELRDEVRQRLLRSPVLPQLFEMDAINGLIDSHSAQRSHEARLWSLLFLDRWLQTHDQALAQ